MNLILLNTINLGLKYNILIKDLGPEHVCWSLLNEHYRTSFLGKGLFSDFIYKWIEIRLLLLSSLICHVQYFVIGRWG